MASLPNWKGETVVIFASGPSLSVNDVDYARSRARTIMVNDTYKLAPWADVLFASDSKWWRHHDYARDFKGQRWTHSCNGSAWRFEAARNHLDVVEARNGRGLSTETNLIHLGGNSGFQAINFAYLCGAPRVLLSGFDCGTWGDGRTHFFGKHPHNLEVASPYALFRAHFREIAIDLAKQGIKVINCSRMTTLTCFGRKTLREALDEDGEHFN